jgi:predicted small metal-binding protein
MKNTTRRYNKMKYKLSCKDLGMKDNFETEGNSINLVIKKIMTHGRKDHGMTAEQTKDPRMIKQMKQKMWMRK